MRFNPEAKLDPSQIDDRRGERNPIMTPTARPTNALAIAADAQGRMARGFRRWSPGILGGRTEVASPARPSSKGVLVPARVAGSTSDVDYLWVTRITSQTLTGAQTFIEYEEIYQSSGTSISWDAGAPTIVLLEADGIYSISAGLPFIDVDEGDVALMFSLADSAFTFEVDTTHTFSTDIFANGTGVSVAHCGWFAAGTELKTFTNHFATGSIDTMTGASGSGFGPFLSAVRLA